jgi:SAM-dependent methyltransferase
MDWSVGHYERTAAQLAPAARVVVEHAAVQAGERVVDVGCGTGNAALVAAERGARVVGVDPATRLLEVARAEAAARGLDATFEQGEAAQLPLGDGEADVVLSVFGVIFAPDAAAAVGEIARVTAPGGRIAISAWIPEGTISDGMKVVREAIDRAMGGPSGPQGFAWHQHDVLSDLFAAHGFGEIAVHEEQLAFTAASAREYLDSEGENHPMAVAGRALLERSGEGPAVRERMLAIFEAGNEDPDAFRVTSRYIVALARRNGA